MNLLGDFPLALQSFDKIHEKLDHLEKLVSKVPDKLKIELIHKKLLEALIEEKEPCFLLKAVAEFIQEVNRKGMIREYCFSKFEFWLNRFSGVSPEEEYKIRAKIVGRYVPRDVYQVLFPIGMGKVHPGAHYVTAHGSPDLDTTVASFWGWVDAFAAKVGSATHLWNIPGGPPEGQVEIDLLFSGVFGEKFFENFAKTRLTLGLHAADLISYKTIERKKIDCSLRGIEQFTLIEDEEGYYKGDWRAQDGHYTNKVTMPLLGLVRGFIIQLSRNVAYLLSEDVVSKSDIEALLATLADSSIDQIEMYKELSKKQKERMETMFFSLLGLSSGWKTTHRDLWKALGLELDIEEIFTGMFDLQGTLQKRQVLFKSIGLLEEKLEEKILQIKEKLSSAAFAMQVKKSVFQQEVEAVSSKAEVEEIRSKIGSYSQITVATTDGEGKKFALGVIYSADLFRSVLGTVSLRDFCNRDETKVPSYLEVISVVDHHKTSLQTQAAATVHIADAQSANVLTANIAFSINDQYSFGGCTNLDQDLQHSLETGSYRKAEKILKKKIAVQNRGAYFIDPKREYLEYIHYLYAILDDTDLLSKVSWTDIECVVSLINRMKTLSTGSETELIVVTKNGSATEEAKKILKDPDLHSLYKKVYDAKEIAVEKSLEAAGKKEVSALFADTKIQNGCCRVGQSKLFSGNFKRFHLLSEKILHLWTQLAMMFHAKQPECDLHMHMISTVLGAEDVYHGRSDHHQHLDELWIWIPMKDQAFGHLRTFLDAFHLSPSISSNPIEVEFRGKETFDLMRIFDESFNVNFKKSENQEGETCVILRYRAGLLNSRKAMISPYLPKIV